MTVFGFLWCQVRSWSVPSENEGQKIKVVEERWYKCFGLLGEGYFSHGFSMLKC